MMVSDTSVLESVAYIDDRIKNGSELWYKNGRLIHFGNEQFPDWDLLHAGHLRYL